MNNYFIPEMKNFMDTGKKISHQKFALLLENTLLDDKKRQKLKLPTDIVADLTEWCYPPIIQSGGKYDLKPSANSDDSNLHGGTVIGAFGVRYKSYCSNVARTFLINAEKKKEENYQFLLDLQAHVLGLIKEGVACNAVYNGAVSFIEKSRPDLKDSFTKNCGFGIGIEFRESQFLISPKNARVLNAGQLINLTLGFQNLSNKSSDSKNTTYAVFLGDTIQVTADAPIIITDVEKSLASISFSHGDEDDDDDAEVEDNGRGAIIKTKRRNENDGKEKMSNELKRRAHQKILADARHADGLKRFNGTKDATETDDKAVFRKFESYRKDAALPKAVSDLRILVDRRAETIILPIYGQAVPFHISTLKNVSKSDEQDFVLLRFNFITPGVATGKVEVV